MSRGPSRNTHAVWPLRHHHLLQAFPNGHLPCVQRFAATTPMGRDSSLVYGVRTLDNDCVITPYLSRTSGLHGLNRTEAPVLSIRFLFLKVSPAVGVKRGPIIPQHGWPARNAGSCPLSTFVFLLLSFLPSGSLLFQRRWVFVSASSMLFVRFLHSSCS